jgi:uncharacterized protein YcfJ
MMLSRRWTRAAIEGAVHGAVAGVLLGVLFGDGSAVLFAGLLGAACGGLVFVQNACLD